MSGQLSMEDHKNYTVAEGAPVPEILKGMLGPRCDENRDASHQLELKIKAICWWLKTESDSYLFTVHVRVDTSSLSNGWRRRTACR